LTTGKNQPLGWRFVNKVPVALDAAIPAVDEHTGSYRSVRQVEPTSAYINVEWSATGYPELRL
jgi:hypothetical protein